jgi:hypothetical protein
MRTVRSVALLCALFASSLAWGDETTGVDIDISRNGVIETIGSPEKLAELLLSIAERCGKSSQKDPAAHWDEAFTQPNWIRASFVPGREMRIAAGRRDAATQISEILVPFPTSARGRRWPDFILLKTDVGVLSIAKWSVCEMNDLVVEAKFDLKDEAEPFQQYRDYCTTARAKHRTE